MKLCAFGIGAAGIVLVFLGSALLVVCATAFASTEAIVWPTAGAVMALLIGFVLLFGGIRLWRADR